MNATNKSGNTPLTCAVEQRNLAAVEALLTAFKSLLKAGDVASLDATDTNGNTIFHLAAAIDDPAILKKLIEYIPEVSRKEVLNKKNSAGRMPIFSAIKRGYKDVTEVLIQSGADVNAESAYSATPLYFAVHCGNLAIVKLLLDYGAKPFAKLVNNNTAFQLAVSRGHKPIIRILIQQAVTKILEQDANVDAAVDSQRNTLLHLAAKEGHIEIAQMLITQGADKAVKNNSNATPLAYALSNIKDLKIQKKLLSVFDAKDLGECSICLDKLVPESSENMILLHGLDCGHIFHADCIAKSIENNIKTCPNCRAHIPK
ncbi:ankyrin repeat domain-containing protein [Cardinium endosymbiont of Culicoides punctatus]|uniref:ankyrin repeat domain-containing protein n=1 Tax=Cardinium endosymbiont of Culicoides punctatus TaxID=2304601 RepID=UPI0021006983|nr:ankyrin repeat domain-containing protein [Cardinium endosymbiont of Culicoides punctatus]